MQTTITFAPNLISFSADRTVVNVRRMTNDIVRNEFCDTMTWVLAQARVRKVNKPW